MGKSLPPPAAFDLISSFARVSGSDVEIVLASPKLSLPDATVQMTLRRGKRVVPATGTIEEGHRGNKLVVHARRGDLRDGTWGLSLRRDDGTRERIAARLLVQGARPVVLLWGANDRPSAVPPPRRVLTPRRRAAAAGGHVLDRVLAVLPERHARKLRSNARRLARRIAS